MRFSANLGYLWIGLPLVQAIRAAAKAGFGAVECHYPYDTPAEDIADVLTETGLRMLSLNTRPGNAARGEIGLAALPGREAEARDAIEQAFGYADRIGAEAVHVMAGRAAGAEAAETFAGNLTFAADRAAETGVGGLVEPLNAIDVPGYFLGNTEAAAEILSRVGRREIGLILDVYHVLKSGGDPVADFRRLGGLIGHVQFAKSPTRGTPDPGTLAILQEIEAEGWSRPFGAEYRPDGPTETSLGWMRGIAS